MSITHTTVAGAITVTSQLKKNLTTNWKDLADYKEFPCKLWHILKGLKIQSKHNCDLPKNSQDNSLCRALQTTLQELSQHGG